MRKFFLASVLVALALVVSCAPAATVQTRTTKAGVTLSWTPAEPLLGDQITLNASFPATEPGSEPVAVLLDPAGKAVEAQNIRYLPTGRVATWVLRLNQPGSWTWTDTEGSEKLFAIVSVAGEAKEIKTLDANSLWTGTPTPATTPKVQP